MALRVFVLIALVACVYIATCAADQTEASSSSEEEASSSSNGSSATSTYSGKSRTTSSKRKKCKKEDKCPKNEEFSFCTFSIGRPQFCSQRGQKLRASDERQSCKEGCVCNYGYLRNNNGTCIPARQCNTDCAPSEILDDCPVDSPSNYCPISEADTGISVRPKPDQCPSPVCKCRFNYRRVNNGSCIPTRDCPPFNCSSRPNEEFDPCPPLCPTDDCSQASPTGKCPLLGRIGIILNCQPKCRCIKGYWRKKGICVPYAKCPNICPRNEEYVPCKQGVCRAMNCSQIGELVPCPDRRYPEEECDPGCICKENFYRNNDGDCVSKDQCKDDNEPSCGPNQESKCVNDCPPEKTCKNRFIKYSCLQVFTPCIYKCVCKKGYIKNSSDVCIPEDQCVDRCPINEEFNSCIQSVCRNQNCSNKDDSVACVRLDPKYCKKGCVCKENHYRNSIGTCVSYDECEAPVCRDDEYLAKCPSDCTSEYCPTCEEDYKSCPRPDPCLPSKCKCRLNTRRAENGTCIPTESCPPFDCSARPNEEYVPCPPYCPTDECNLNRVRGLCPFRIGTLRVCSPKCQCKEGYGRVNGTCVPYKECPDLCRQNEEYNKCTQTVCRNQNCDNRSKSVACARIDPTYCNKGCVCKKNYYRNQKGLCVAEDECEDPRCPNPHEKYASSRIPKCPLLGTCDSIVARIACDKPEEFGCVCADGYLREYNQTSACIPTCQCPQMASAEQCKKPSYFN